MMNKFSFILFIVFFQFSSLSFSQEIYFEALVTEIEATNILVVEDLENQRQYRVRVRDTDSLAKNHSQYKKAINYLNSKVLDKNILVFYESINGNTINGSILYDCIPNDDLKTKEESPCKSAYNLDVELIKKGFVIYKGSNKFLQKIGM